MADLLVFSVLISSSQSIFVSAGCCRRPFFVKEYAVDQWIMWRTSHFLHYFLFFIGVAADDFSWRYFPYLLVNKERATLHHNHEVLEICSLSWKYSPSAPRAPHQKRREKWGFTWEPFFPLFLNYFEPPEAIWLA
jgi:hypothetical protein